MKTSLAANRFQFLCALCDSAREFLQTCLARGWRFRKPVDDSRNTVLYPFQPKVQKQPSFQQARAQLHVNPVGGIHNLRGDPVGFP